MDELKKRCNGLVMGYIVPDDANGGHVNVVKVGNLFTCVGLARITAKLIEDDTANDIRYGGDE